MFKNIGKKIKILAIVTFWLEAVAAVVVGIVLISSGTDFGVVVIFGGIALALVSGWLLYGFGELIDKACEIARNTSKVENDRIERIERLRSRGLITEEDYKKAISNNNAEG